MSVSKINYELMGGDIQAVEVELAPNETIVAETGAMNWMDEGISFETKMGDGSDPKRGFFDNLMEAGRRFLVGESLFLTHFTNQTNTNKKMGFAAPYPGKVLPIDLEAFSGKIYCHKESFLCATLGTKVSIELNQRFGFGFFANNGFIIQELEGNGQAFLHTGGTIVKKILGEETLRVSMGCVVAYSQGIVCNVERIKGWHNVFFGKEGAFVTSLSGTGVVYLQSLPFSKLADQVISRMPVKYKVKERARKDDWGNEWRNDWLKGGQ